MDIFSNKTLTNDISWKIRAEAQEFNDSDSEAKKS